MVTVLLPLAGLLIAMTANVAKAQRLG